MIVDNQEEIVRLLNDPRTYADVAQDIRDVTREETHTAIVFLAGSRAYKMKRAVRYDYLDFSTLERRKAFAENELKLNRRTAPEIYRRIIPVTREADGSLELEGAGEPVEWLVEMTRFAADGLFERMARDQRLDGALMERLAGHIADFHGRARVHRDRGGADDFRDIVDGCINGLRPFSPDVFCSGDIDELESRLSRALEATAALMDKRRDEGFVRHGHGDLHLRNICLVDGEPRLFDAIEFNDDFAITDVLYDVAFLLMDLMHRDARPFANRTLIRYLIESGAFEHIDDLAGLALLPQFLALRAAIRAEVGAQAAALAEDETRKRRLHIDCHRYLADALTFLAPPSPRLVAIGGLSGSGKSTLAMAVAPEIGAAPGALVTRSDILRKRMFNIAETEHLDADAYRGPVSEEIYGRMRAIAAAALKAGHSVILDAVFDREDAREKARLVAEKAGMPFQGLWLDADPGIMRRRVEARRNDASDATIAVLESQLRRAGKPGRWMTLDSGGTIEQTTVNALQALRS